MKKIFSSIVITGLLISSFSPFAIEASINDDFNTAQNNLSVTSTNFDQTIMDNRTASKLQHSNANINAFDDFGVVNQDNCYISLTLQIELDDDFGYQCVGVVKAITDLGVTSTWDSGQAVTVWNLPSRGYVIATCDSNGDYDFGHVAVVLSASNTHIYVIDQNWEGTGHAPVGRVIIHAIPFNGVGNGDADSYNIVEH